MIIKVNDNGAPFPPSKHVHWFARAWDEWEKFPEADDLMDEIWDVYRGQCDKITEEYEEQRDADVSILEMTTDEAINELGELADLVQATVQKMYMLGHAFDIPVSQMLATTMLKCITRDKDFYGDCE